MDQCDATLIKNERLCSDIVRLTLRAPSIVAEAKPGQFINLKAGPGYDPLLRRPFSIHQVYADGTLQVLFKVLGKGTRALANLPAGQSVNIVGPLGNHFKTSASMCLVGGGLGIAPLLFLAKKARERHPQGVVKVILGARNAEELSCFAQDFETLAVAVHLTTDDGTLGHHGLVTDLIPSVLEGMESKDGQVCCCGPYPMMKEVASLCRRLHWSCQVSLETMMACGISACLGCTVVASATNSKGGHYLHVCKDGPVFFEGELAWK